MATNRPNKIYSREQTIWGIPASIVIGGSFCSLLFITLLLTNQGLNNSIGYTFIPAALTGYLSGDRWKEFMLGLVAHPQLIYIRGDKRELLFDG
jgi:hypothetical protein